MSKWLVRDLSVPHVVTNYFVYRVFEAVDVLGVCDGVWEAVPVVNDPVLEEVVSCLAIFVLSSL